LVEKQIISQLEVLEVRHRHWQHRASRPAAFRGCPSTANSGYLLNAPAAISDEEIVGCGTACDFMRGRSRANLKAPRRCVDDVLRMTIVAVFATAFMTSVSSQDFLAEPGTPAVAFPKPVRPVANIVSPIWHDEKERDDAGEPGQLVRLLGIKLGMTVADIGAGSGYYVVRLSPIVGPSGRIIAQMS
jgi:hypothetical protein